MTQKSDLAKLDKNFAPVEVANDLKWYDIRDLGLEGQGWRDTESPYDRLPARAKSLVRSSVWELSQCSSGLCARFMTDSTSISARWTLRNATLGMNHMPASGMSGLDLYVKIKGKWIWAGVGIPNAQTTSGPLGGNYAPGLRECLLYLPLYNGVTSAAIGIETKARLAMAPRRAGGKAAGIAVYGTSITQGGCASRSGMGYVELLARALDCHSINLGFSGNGPLEIEVIRFMAELNPAIYILDCLPNMNAVQVRERTEPAVRALRAAHPATPIVLVENITYQRAPAQVPGMAGREDNNVELKAAWQRLRKAGVKGLFYVPGAKLLGGDNLGTVDGTHPTDAGFLRIAKALESVVRKIGLRPPAPISKAPPCGF
ncbi:MAG: SGNH/GDSL hydrolase family protein [Kiritimatiellia bacterium]|jgi:hypothetical protein